MTYVKNLWRSIVTWNDKVSLWFGIDVEVY